MYNTAEDLNRSRPPVGADASPLNTQETGAIRCSSCQRTMRPDEAFSGTQGLVCPVCHYDDELAGVPAFQLRPRGPEAAGINTLSYLGTCRSS